MADPIEIPRNERQSMLAAGEDILECYRVLRNTNDNIVGEVLRDQGTFYEWNHYPEGDVYDRENGSQYFYHAHPTELREGEHGHFHTFLRKRRMPPDARPVPYDGEVAWPAGDDALSHLIGISMDPKGYPISLFTTNRWVTGETWYAARDVCAMLDLYAIDHARPSWPVNRWITGMLRLFRRDIIALIHERDKTVKAWQEKHPDTDVYEDRLLEITSRRKVSVEARMAELIEFQQSSVAQLA
jgi:hypothetical protein